MKFHVFKPLTFFMKSRGVKADHSAMFHGRASRGGKMPTFQDYRLHVEVDRPLRLHKNAYEIAPVFSPEFELVVSETVREALFEFPTLRFEPVEFETLYSCPYRIGDPSFMGNVEGWYEFQDFVDGQKDVPELHRQVGLYFSVEVPLLRNIREPFSDLQDLVVPNDDRAIDRELEVTLSRELLQEYPLFNSGGNVASDELYAKLRPFINQNYNTHVEGVI